MRAAARHDAAGLGFTGAHDVCGVAPRQFVAVERLYLGCYVTRARQSPNWLQTLCSTAKAAQTVGGLRHEFFKRDRTMAAILVGVILALLLGTALGIVGLASFWVSQRRKQISIRRAIGATRGDILRYFQIENFLIVSLGAAIGILSAYGLNGALMRIYELSRLPVDYLLFGAIAQWLLGQLAVSGPALSAARVPPVVATRSV